MTHKLKKWTLLDPFWTLWVIAPKTLQFQRKVGVLDLWTLFFSINK